jgi:hypothetical protein
MNKSHSNAKHAMNMGTLRKVSHKPKNPSHKNRTRTNGNNQKGKKLMGRTAYSNPPQGQGKKSTAPRDRSSSSPQKGESIHNRFVGIPNPEENNEAHRDHQEGNEKRRQEETKEENRKGKEKEIMISSGDDTVKSVSYPLPEIHVLFEEDQ